MTYLLSTRSMWKLCAKDGSEKCAHDSNFVRGNGRRHVTDMRTLPTNKPLRTSRIKGDGNCLFRTFSKILTGNQDDHGLLRTMTVSNIMDNLTTMRQVSPNIAQHLHTSNMISLGTWYGSWNICIGDDTQCNSVHVRVHSAGKLTEVVAIRTTNQSRREHSLRWEHFHPKP